MPTVLEFCREHGVTAAELRAIGSFETVEVTEYDQAAHAWKASRKLAGGCEILSLVGNVSERGHQPVFHAHVTVMRDTDNGIQVLGGHLVSARVFAVEIVIETFEALVLRRDVDSGTGLALWSSLAEIRASSVSPGLTTPTPAGSSPTAPTWRDVAAASPKPAPPTADEPDDGLLAPGDILIHPTFGRCDVERIEGGNEFAHVRLKNARLVRLSLEVIKVVTSGVEQGRRVFRARVNG